jgi:hypothetical protein
MKVFNAHKSDKLTRMFTPPVPAWATQLGGAGAGAADENNPLPLKKQKTTITRVDWCDKERADVIMVKITRFIVGCALAFLIIESVFFLEMIAALNTAFLCYLVKADVERVCKAHKVIHTKSRNLLLAKTVQMLLFTYCNLRLLNQCPELGDFLTSAMASCADEGEEPLPAGEADDSDSD